MSIKTLTVAPMETIQCDAIRFTIETKLEMAAFAMHCGLNAARLRASRTGLFLAKFVLQMRINCCLRASGKNFWHRRWIFNDPDF